MHAIRLLARGVIAGGLAVDAWVHADLAHTYANYGHPVSQGDLFLAEAVVSTVTAVLVLVWPRWQSLALAFVVAATAFGAVMLYRYVDVGSLGPLPNMYEPVWYPEKTYSAIAETVAAMASALFLLASLRPPGRSRSRSRAITWLGLAGVAVTRGCAPEAPRPSTWPSR